MEHFYVMSAVRLTNRNDPGYDSNPARGCNDMPTPQLWYKIVLNDCINFLGATFPVTIFCW